MMWEMRVHKTHTTSININRESKRLVKPDWSALSWCTPSWSCCTQH